VAEIRRIKVQRQSGQIVLKTLSQKYPTQKRAGSVAQVVQCLPNKCKLWIPSSAKKKIIIIKIKLVNRCGSPFISKVYILASLSVYKNLSLTFSFGIRTIPKLAFPWASWDLMWTLRTTVHQDDQDMETHTIQFSNKIQCHKPTQAVRMSLKIKTQMT
jgi:hypothetical protein